MIKTVLQTRPHFILLLAASLFFVSGFFHTAEALTVSPVRIEVSANTGEVFQGEYKLINESESSRTYFNSFENFEASGEDGTPNFVSSNSGLSSWMTGPEQITLAPFETKIVPFSINVPSGVTPGGYFAATFWGTAPTNVETENGLQVNSKVGILVLLRVNGDIVEDGGIVDFEITNKAGLIDSLPLSFAYRFQNDGADRLKPAGDVVITNTFGGEVVSFDANINQGNVLPFSLRKYSLDWDHKENQNEVVGFFAKVKHQWSDFKFGFYKANLDLTFGQQSQNETSVIPVFIFPWQLLISIIVILILLRFTGKRFLGRYKARIIRQSQSKNK